MLKNIRLLTAKVFRAPTLLGLIVLQSFWACLPPLLAYDAKIFEELEHPTLKAPTPTEASEIKPSHVVFWAGQASLHQDGSVVVALHLQTKNNFALYAERIEFSSRSGMMLLKVLAPEAKVIDDPVTAKQAQVYTGGDFLLHFQNLEALDLSAFPLSIRYTACADRICLFPYTEELDLSLSKSSEAIPLSLSSAGVSKPSIEAPAKETPPSPSGETFEERLAERLQLGDLGLAMMLLALFLGGLVTNLTPCVYPMIPITIRLLGRQTKSPILAASAYAMGIVVIYSALGLSVAYTGSLFGQYMANPWVNATLALIMFVLGFSMLGFGQWNALSTLGNKLGVQKPGLLQAFLMGCGAGMVASPCTGPILASLLTYIITNKDLGHSALYILTYSLGFALPYVVLGGLSGKLATVKISPKVQVFVKVSFASIMFALSLYYLRVPLYKTFTQLKPYWQTMCFVSLGLGIILGRMMWQVQKKKAVKWFMVWPALFFGTGIFAANQWLFLRKTDKPSAAQILWYHNEEEAIAQSLSSGRPLLIDFWAEWCAACKKMDATTFIDESFIHETRKQEWVFLKFDVTEDTPANTKLLEKYKVQGLPTLVLIKAAAEPVKVSGYASTARLLNYLN